MTCCYNNFVTMVPEVNQLVPNQPFLYPQVKHQVTLQFSDAFRG